MRSLRWLIAGVLAVPIAGWAQEADVAVANAAPDAAAAVAAEDADLLGEDELDALVAPVALYPDALLAQIFVAATYPLDVMKADRFVEASAGLSDKERADKAEAEDWDPSVVALAGGFPTVVEHMADEIDWTQQLGDAMLAQTDDVLDAVQRQRARAVATGYLTTNEAQTVEAEGDSIAIAPTDPDVVYVPSYDAQAAYTTPPTAAPVVVDQGMTTSDVLTTGAIAFGSALLINEIFDDDDDYDYWHGPNHIDWDDDDFHPGRPGISAGGDVNIDVDRDRNRVRIGDRDGPGDRDGGWNPTPAQRQEARDRIAARQPAGGGGDRAATAKARIEARGGAGTGAAGVAAGAAGGKLAASRAGDSGARDKLAAATAKREAAGKPPVADSAFSKAGSASGQKVKAAAARGDQSLGRSKAAKPAAAAKPRQDFKPAAKPKNIARPKAAVAPKKYSAPKNSAFKKSSSGSRAKAASSRGHASRGGGNRGGRR